MTKYLISFDEGAMDFSSQELSEVTAAGLAVARQARDAGVWVFSGGLMGHESASVVATDGTVTKMEDGVNHRHLGGFAVVEVASRVDAVEWAARIAVACRCAQEVREFVPEPSSESADGRPSS